MHFAGVLDGVIPIQAVISYKALDIKQIRGWKSKNKGIFTPK